MWNTGCQQNTAALAQTVGQGRVQPREEGETESEGWEQEGWVQSGWLLALLHVSVRVLAVCTLVSLHCMSVFCMVGSMHCILLNCMSVFLWFAVCTASHVTAYQFLYGWQCVLHLTLLCVSVLYSWQCALHLALLHVIVLYSWHCALHLALLHPRRLESSR